MQPPFIKGKTKTVSIDQEGRGDSKNETIFKIKVSKSDITKRFLAYLGFRSNALAGYTFTTNITGTRGFEEAKVCSGG
ncbi:MAG: hypothetical protein LBD11_08205, partial [Candidatus Peribacteria bacterium]|nr:hypothetical protein [Candidatus Peribacteria bacterium]